MANLLAWARAREQQFGNVANRVYHQVSPFDNGATYQNPRPGFRQVNGTWYANQPQQQQAPPPPRPLPGPPPANQPLQIGHVSVNNTAQTTALQHAPPAQSNVPLAVAQGLARAPLNIGVSIADKFKPGHQQFNPQPGIQQAVFGKQPVTSYQDRYTGLQKAIAGQGIPNNGNLEQKVIAGLRQKLSVPLAVAGTAANAGGDVSVVSGAGKLASTGVKVAAQALPKVAIKDTAFKAMSAAKPGLTQLDQSGKLRLPNLGGQNQDFHYTAPTNGYTKLSGKASDVRAQLTKLNEQGGINNKPNLPNNVSPEEAAQYAHTFKVSPDQAAQELSKLKVQDSVSAGRQMRKPQGVGLPQGVKDQLQPKVPFKRAAIENTQLNPRQINIPEVQPGDYAQARINPQLASNPIDFATGQAVKAAQKLSSTEKTNIPHLVENPALAKSPAAKKFVARHNDLTNLTHATSQALGGNTNFVPNYFRHNVDLSNPADAAQWEKLVAKRGGAAADPYAFGGIDNMNRVFNSVKELQDAKFHLRNENNPIQNIIDYGKSASNTLKRQALVKGFTEADMQAGPKLNNFDLHNGNVIPLSDQGIKEIQGYARPAKPNAVHAGYRTVNRKAKQTLLSASEFHPINISAMKAAPTLALEGHPALATKGLYGTFRAQVGRGYADKIQQAAFKDGTVEAGARIGAPIKFGSDYANEGKLNLGKAGFGEKTIFEKSMPAMHIQMVKGVVKDLGKRGLSLDSPEAKAAGTRINEIMGFVNTEARNLNAGRQRALSDLALAPQFTRAKWATLKGALTERGVAGSYARRALVGNAAADFTVIAGLGYALKQKSDNIRDMILRAILNPAVPTPLKDNKGNTVQLKTPASYTSEALGLAITLERGSDGHLHPKFKPTDIPGNIANYGRNRLAIVPSNVLKLATNTNYAGKPLYDPHANPGVKAEQAATTVASGLLPIGLQGIAQTKTVKSKLPGNIQDVINANSPGANPLVKSIGSSFGLTPTTDKTVGKGLENTRYFAAANDALKQTTNNSEKTALQNYLGSKKNPVTGKYDVTPNPNDTGRKAKDLLDAPRTIGILIDMNRKLKAQGAKTDPLWNLSSDQVTKVLQYETMPYGGPDKKHWLNQNQSWYGPLSNQRQAFFNSLPAGDPNKPKQPIEFPSPTPQVAAKQQQYFNITDGAQRAKFLQDNPDVQAQLDKSVQYNNDMRVATLGAGSALDTFPKASPQVQQIINAYNAVPKGGGSKGGNKFKAQWIQSHPKEYAAMTQYFTQASLYGLEQDASQAQFKDTGFSSKGLGDISNLGKYDIKQGKSASGAPVYALTTGQSGGATYTDQSGNTFADLGQASGSGSSSYSSGTGKTKSYRPKGVRVKRAGSGKKGSGSTKAITKGFKLPKAATSGFKAPKGIKIKVPAQPKFKQPKLGVSKIPKTRVVYKTKKMS